ncbi:hypothetical protein MNEG_5070 [Monoraphidium neglectum]|uniref:Uncharacterized protein n=1 Tax=Monoraphidium neglectum TaxID=145388 RepID=A0A0D2MIM1_9CHLO|nr:hypothetical protein MNEG_5070 [Monoraphidium neglectum]KIZ02885.1 hypothetical protein MNEG_5070 [Monoraphidium neglectum]|eukprot:XP_013901904.1 hypothetical protein MNEG_5070 [Monoraphidium neglectum]
MAPNVDQDDSRVVVDNTPFPDPKLYFKVFDSERDEPETKYREDVNKLYDRVKRAWHIFDCMGSNGVPALAWPLEGAKWLKKHGRKWPDNGLNTEDLVWLYEEAYKDEAAQEEAAERAVPGGPGGRRGGRGRRGQVALEVPRIVNQEREDIPGELMESSGEALEAAVEGLPADPKARAAAVARAKREVENATWVTDEFESSEYERGNLEAVHDMYLWDREGKTTIMPEGAGD